MSVYRELAAELRANKAVIDSLNSRNQQLTQQNQFLKQEIHNVVQATLNLGQAAGVARQAARNGAREGTREGTREETKGIRTDLPSGLAEQMPWRLAPDTLANLVNLPQAAPSETMPEPQTQSMNMASQAPRNRVPRPIAQQPAQPKKVKSGSSAPRKSAVAAKSTGRPKLTPSSSARRTETIPGKGTLMHMPAGKLTDKLTGKLFTEKGAEYRSSMLDSSENKEIGGIWLALSIILIVVTAFGAGFLVMKPLLNDR